MAHSERFITTERALRAVVAAASSEAAQRDMQMMHDLNRGYSMKPSPPQLREPRLHDDHAQRVADLKRKIYERGVAIDRDKLVSLGKKRFDELLAADRVARTERIIGTRCDLTSFAGVFYAFAQAGALQHLTVKEPTMHEQLSGVSTQLDEARQVESFRDLFKFFASEPRAVRAIYAFNDRFESLVFAQSLFTWIDDDDRVHHKFFCGASADKVRLFEAWLRALKGAHYRVKITNALAALVFWLARETGEPPPEARDLAKDFFQVRAPSIEQIKFAAALFDGFLLNHKDWNLWQHVGRATRSVPDQMLLQSSLDQLRERFSKVAAFHQQLGASFFRPVTDHGEFEPTRHRQFVNATLDELRDCVSALVALTVEENSPSDAACVVARFRDSILCSGKAKAQIVERIDERLSSAFQSSAFKIEIEEVAT